jgi:hypothetical protein
MREPFCLFHAVYASGVESQWLFSHYSVLSVSCCLRTPWVCFRQMKAGWDVPATDRVRQRIDEWIKANGGHGAGRKLLAIIKARSREDRSDQWLSDIINRRQNVTLADLDILADAMDVQPGELVRLPGKNYLELTMGESRLVQIFRGLSRDAQGYVNSLITYFVSPKKASGKSVQNSTAPSTTSGIQHAPSVRTGAGGGTAYGAVRDADFRAEDATPETIDRLIADTTERLAELHDVKLQLARAAKARARAELQTPKRGPQRHTPSDPSAPDR